MLMDLVKHGFKLAEHLDEKIDYSNNMELLTGIRPKYTKHSGKRKPSEKNIK